MHNLQRTQQKWDQLSRVLGREVADARTMGSIYVSLFRAVLLYGSETWAMTSYIGRVLGIFHHRVARRLIVQQPWRVRDNRWVYPLLTEAMEEEVLQEVDTYVSFRKNTVAQFIATMPIMDLCMSGYRRMGSRVDKW